MSQSERLAVLQVLSDHICEQRLKRLIDILPIICRCLEVLVLSGFAPLFSLFAIYFP